MSTSHTLGSKLKVLIAKSFKAEKLYASMTGSGIDQKNSVRVELANEVRAREWQRSYYQLRVVLNKLVSENKITNIVEDLERVKLAFLKKSSDSLQEIKSGRDAMSDALTRDEFAFVYRSSLEMIRHKARSEAYHVAAQEIDALLEGRKKKDASEPFEIDDLEDPQQPAPQKTSKTASKGGKVISLVAKRSALGGRRR